ncbi:hypothetical protein LINPERPRIM_LOCUS19186 [Linum perenne]
MTFAVGRLFLSPPVTARILLSSSNNPLPQCQLRRQNHTRRGLNFHVAPTRKEAIVNGFSNSFCPMYFGRRRCIYSASESTPPEEHESDNDGATMEKKEEKENKTMSDKDYCSSDDDSNKDVGYILLATLGWFILAWTCPDFYDQLCGVVGGILEAVLRPLFRVVWRILEVIWRILEPIWPLFWRILEAIAIPYLKLAIKILHSRPDSSDHSIIEFNSLGEFLIAVFIILPFMAMCHACAVGALAMLLFVTTVLLLLIMVLTFFWWYRRGGAADDRTAAKRRFPSCG